MIIDGHTQAYAFSIWMMAQPGAGVGVTVPQVRQKFGVSRATAYRWLGLFRAELRLFHEKRAA